MEVKSVCLTADISPSASYLIKPRVTKGLCSGWARLRRVPSLRSRSVGPRRTDIHVLTALSPHPCGSAHCARPAFSLHSSRVFWCLGFLRRKIKSRSNACRLKPVPQLSDRAYALRGHAARDALRPFAANAGRCAMHALLSVGPALAGKGPVCAPSILRRDDRRLPG